MVGVLGNWVLTEVDNFKDDTTTAAGVMLLAVLTADVDPVGWVEITGKRLKQNEKLVKVQQNKTRQ